MAQTLDEFLIEAREDIVIFEKMWRAKNAENPDMYPLEMANGNEGLWWEFLQNNDEQSKADEGQSRLSVGLGMEVEMNANFEVVSRPHGDCWKHKTQDFWIVFYESLKQAGKPGFSAYRAIEGSYQRDPWTVNNRCVGRFHTLDAAMAHADA